MAFNVGVEEEVVVLVVVVVYGDKTGTKRQDQLSVRWCRSQDC